MTKPNKFEQARSLIRQADQDLSQNNWLKAEVKLRCAIRLDSQNPEAYFYLGEALCKQERFDESLAVLKKADALLPNNGRIIHLIGWVYLMLRNIKKGRQFMERALRYLPQDIQLLCDLAVLENRSGNFAKAKQYTTLALRIDPTNDMAQEVQLAISAFKKLKDKLLGKKIVN